MMFVTSRRPLFLSLAIASVLGLATNAAHSELVLFYDFNDPSGGDVVVDVSGNDNTGEVFDAEFSADGDGRTGLAGDRAMDFGEYDNFAYVEVSTAVDGAFDTVTDNDSATIAMWILGNEDQPSPQWTFYAGPGRQLGAHTPWSDGTIYWDTAGCCDGGTQRIQAAADREDWSEDWNHYAFVKDAGYTAMYINGELFHDSEGLGERIELSEITEFYIGSGPAADNRSYNGLIDDFGVWDNALSEDEVLELFQGGNVGGEPGDFDNNGILDAADIDGLTAAVIAGNNPPAFDLDGNGIVDSADRTQWVTALRKTWFGDANLDGEFNSSDFVFVFTAGEYEDNVAGNSTWATGDWNADGDFTSSDFVTAFTDGGYENGPRPAAAVVPEPSGAVLLLLGVSFFLQAGRRSV